jgi:hypothetical protein
LFASQVAIENGLTPLSIPEHVGSAREKKLIRDEKVDLVPDKTHAALTGQLEFVDFGEHLLGLAGLRRKAREVEVGSRGCASLVA